MSAALMADSDSEIVLDAGVVLSVTPIGELDHTPTQDVYTLISGDQYSVTRSRHVMESYITPSGQRSYGPYRSCLLPRIEHLEVVETPGGWFAVYDGQRLTDTQAPADLDASPGGALAVFTQTVRRPFNDPPPAPPVPVAEPLGPVAAPLGPAAAPPEHVTGPFGPVAASSQPTLPQAPAAAPPPQTSTSTIQPKRIRRRQRVLPNVIAMNFVDKVKASRSYESFPRGVLDLFAVGTKRKRDEDDDWDSTPSESSRSGKRQRRVVNIKASYLGFRDFDVQLWPWTSG